MIIASIRFNIAADNGAAFLATVKTVLEPTRAMQGCSSCRLYQESTEPSCWLLLEEWLSQEDLSRHLKSKNYQKILEAIELSDEPPEVKFTTTFKVDGLELVEIIRNSN